MKSKIADMLYLNATKTPEKTAIWCDGRELSYSDFAGLVSRYSNFLIKLGVGYGDHIANPMNNSIESVALIFSAADMGVCLVPLNPTIPMSSIKAAMQASDAKHLIARRAFFSECEKKGGLDIEGASICLDGEYPGTVPFDEIYAMSASRPVCHDINGDESLILTMTSGSTGNPKPIDLSQNNKLERAKAHIRLYHITSEDKVLAATPLYHSLAERLVILPLVLGATSILLPRFTPKIWLSCVKGQRVSFTIAVSAQLAQIIQELKSADDASEITSLRAVVSSSALLEENVKKELISRLHCEFHEMYGTSETSTVTSICFQKESHKQKSVGRPIDVAKVRILRNDETDPDTDCKPYETGEIVCRSSLICKGYYKQEAMMQSSMFEGYFRTGDLGYLDEDGYLYFTGRLKEIIITGAVNVYPYDIDRVVNEIPEVEECAAFPYPDERLGEIVALAVVPKEDTMLNKRTIKTYCARNLADYQQPHKIFIIDKFPKNAMGKLQRMEIFNYIRKMGLDE